MLTFCKWKQKKDFSSHPNFFSNLQSTVGVTSGSATVYFIWIIQDYFNDDNNKINIYIYYFILLVSNLIKT